MVYAKLFKVFDSGFRILPLLPDKAAETSEDPCLQRFEYVSGFGEPIVTPPSVEIRIQFFNDLVQAFPPISVRQFPHTVLESLYGFHMYPDLRLSTHVDECEPEKLAEPWSADRAFLFINLESEFHCEKFCDTRLDPFCGLQAFGIDSEVIGVSNEFVSSLFQLLVQFIKNDIGK